MTFRLFAPPVLEIGATLRYIGSTLPNQAHYGEPCAVVDVYEEKRLVNWYDGAVRFANGEMTTVFAHELLALEDKRWPLVPIGEHCVTHDLVVDAAGTIRRRPHSAFFEGLDRAERHAGGGNGVWFHDVWNGERYVGIPSYSARDPFASIGTEAPRVLGKSGRGITPTFDLSALPDDPGLLREIIRHLTSAKAEKAA